MDLKLKVMDGSKRIKLYAFDRVGKLDDEGHLNFGVVAINRVSKDVRIEWDDGVMENLIQFGDGVVLTNKIGVFDRRSIGFGAKVTKGDKVGTVREKRILVTVVLDKDWNMVLKDIPCEDLLRIGYAKKDDKVVWNNEWVGITVQTRPGITFKMDRNGKQGYTVDESFGPVFPRPGDKVNRMTIYHLWDAKWLPRENSGWWWTTFLRNLGDPATIVEAKLDSAIIAWMGNIDTGIITKDSGINFPSNALRTEQELKGLQHLYGRNWAYLKEYDTWGYRLKISDEFLSFSGWIHQLWTQVFIRQNEKVVEILTEPFTTHSQGIGEGDLKYVRIAAFRSVFDIEWDDETIETVPSSELQPYQLSNMTSGLTAGDLVYDLLNSDKYGIVSNILEDVVMVDWITECETRPVVVRLAALPQDLGLHPEYRYLSTLQNLPVVVPKLKDNNGKRIPIDGVRIGIAVGVNVKESKMIVKCPNGQEKLVWPHDFVHFEADLLYNPKSMKWTHFPYS